MAEHSPGRKNHLVVGAATGAILGLVAAPQLINAIADSPKAPAPAAPDQTEQPVDLDCVKKPNGTLEVALNPEERDDWARVNTPDGILAVQMKIDFDGEAPHVRLAFDGMVETLAPAEFDGRDPHRLPGGVYAIPGYDNDVATVAFTCAHPQLNQSHPL